MHKGLKRLLSFALVFTVVLSLFAISASADPAGGAKLWNVMLVIDGSASLVGKGASDPNNLRYDAISRLLDILPDGSNVGAIVFNANQSGDSSEAAMLTGIVLNTGMGIIDDRNDRQAISRSIESAPMIYRDVPQTDIGTALHVASEELIAAQANNGYPTALFLFTDGVNDVYSAISAKSEEYKDLATSAIFDNNISFCAVFLNKDNLIKSRYLEQIAADATGVPFGYNLGDHYVTISKSEDVNGCTDAFLRLMGMEVPSPRMGTIDDDIFIPGTGVSEAVIELYTANGKDIPYGMDIEISRPDGQLVGFNDPDIYCSSGRTYMIYKLKSPAAGTWHLHVNVPQGVDIPYYCYTLYNISVEASIESDPAPADIFANTTVDFTGYLMDNGQNLTTPDSYLGFDCFMYVYDGESGDLISSFDVQPDANGMYTKQLQADYGSYDVCFEFVTDTFSSASPYLHYECQNNAPNVRNVTLDIKYGLFSDGTGEYDVSNLFSDPEDGKDLVCEVENSSIPKKSFDFNNNILEVNGKESGKGTVDFVVTDSVGESAEFTVYVRVKNLIPIQIGIIAAILVIILVALFIIIRTRNGNVPQGTLKADLTIDGEFIGSSRAFSCSDIELHTPGSVAGRSTDLYELFRMYIKEDISNQLRMQCQDGQYESIASFLEGPAKATLSSMRLYAAGKGGVKFSKDGKTRAPLIRHEEISGDGLTVSVYYCNNKEDSSDDSGYDPFGDDYLPDRGSGKPNKPVSTSSPWDDDTL